VDPSGTARRKTRDAQQIATDFFGELFRTWPNLEDQSPEKNSQNRADVGLQRPLNPANYPDCLNGFAGKNWPDLNLKADRIEGKNDWPLPAHAGKRGTIWKISG